MHLCRLVIKEVIHRKLNFVAGVFSVAIAAACVSGALALLAAHDLRTEELITRKEAETREAMVRMEDDYRRIMRDMGYNVLVLHQDQDIAAMQRDGHPNTYMPDDYALRLAEGGIKTLNHLLPVLQHKLMWDEEGMEIMIAGVTGQTPVRRGQREGGVGPDGTPIMEPVPPGKADVGFTIAQRLDLKPGREFLINGVALTVNKVYPRRSAQDDLSVWVHLDLAQQWFDKPGKINGILALECVCNADSLGHITADVARILPDTQVFEFSSLVKTRALARGRAAEAHRESIEGERRSRAELRREREQLAAVLTPLAVLGAAVWIFLLTVANVRERRNEVGILRALGYSASRIIGLFQLRATAMGILGALPGYGAGVLIGTVLGGAPNLASAGLGLFSLWLFPAALVAAVALSCLAAWIPALNAARQDPAVILREIM